jgi:LemA protein
MANDQFLEAYLKRLMDRDMNLDEADPLSDEQLMKVATDMGMSEDEWHKIKKDALEARDRGFQHLDRGNYEDAIAEFKESTSLYPNAADAMFGMSKALFKKSVEKEDNELSNQAVVYAKRALKINPNYSEALDLQSNIRRHQTEIGSKILTSGKIDAWKKWLIPATIILVLGIFLMGTYNSVTTLQENVDKQWADVQEKYKRRSELIPQLVEVVKATAKNEKEIINGALEMRSRATSINLNLADMTPEKMKEFSEMQNQMSQSLGRLIAVGEQYPQIRSNESFLKLQEEVAGSVNRISNERKKFNESVREYNIKIKRFPTNLFPFKEKAYFEVKDSEMETPNLNL